MSLPNKILLNKSLKTHENETHKILDRICFENCREWYVRMYAMVTPRAASSPINFWQMQHPLQQLQPQYWHHWDMSSTLLYATKWIDIQWIRGFLIKGLYWRNPKISWTLVKWKKIISNALSINICLIIMSKL